MLPNNTTIVLTTDAADFAICAKMMSVTDPWIALGIDYDHCLKSFDGSHREVFLLKKEGEIIGFVIIQPQGTFKGYIQTLAINDAHRGAGLGTLLLQFCQERILQYSPNIFICVSSFNTKAVELYNRFGFELIGELKDFVKTGFTELLLRKTTGPLTDYTKPSAKS